MGPPKAHSIPEDILNLVMEELCDDVGTLKNCALTSHALLAPARRRLFSVVHLINKDDLINFSSLITQNPTISVHIRQLVVYKRSYLPFIQPSRSAISTLLVIHPFLRELHCGNIRSVKNHSFRALPPDLQALFLGVFASPSLERITIGDFYDLPFSHLARCAQLKELAIGCNSGDEAPVSQLESGPSITQDSLCQLYTLQIYCWVCATSILNAFELSSVRSLTIGRQVPFSTIRSLFSSVRHSLEHLHWSPDLVESDFSAGSTITFPDVKSLTLSVPYFTRLGESMAFFVSLLSHGESSASFAIQSITFRLHISGSRDVPAIFEAPGLETALRNPRYSKLRQVVVRITYHPDDKRLAGFLETLVKSLPSIHSCGMLEVWCNDVLKTPENLSFP